MLGSYSGLYARVFTVQHTVYKCKKKKILSTYYLKFWEIKLPHGYTGPNAVAIHNTIHKQATVQQYETAISMENTSPQSRKYNKG